MAVASRATAAFVLLCLWATSHAQQTSPLQGQNWPPEGGTTVFISSVLDRMLTIDDASYRFEAVLYLYLSWTDPRAVDAVNASTYAAYSSGNCRKPCSTDAAWVPGDLCCDSLFLPSFDVTNVRGYSQDNVVRYGITLMNDVGVSWWLHLQGEFYTPLQFKAFPFDRQYLLVQVECNDRDPVNSPITMKSSLTGTQMYQPRSGDMVSGWRITSLTVQPYTYVFLGPMVQASSHSDFNDPLPLVTSNPDVTGINQVAGNNTGFNIIITASRVSGYYIITAIVPIALNVYLGLLVFAVHPKSLDTRLGVIVTLFLALTAILYVVNGYLPASSAAVPTQQLVIVSYFVLALIGLISIIVYEMVTFQNNRSASKRAKQAGNRFSVRWKSFVEERRAPGSTQKALNGSEGGLRRRSKAGAGGGEGAAAGDSAQDKPMSWGSSSIAVEVPPPEQPPTQPPHTQATTSSDEDGNSPRSDTTHGTGFGGGQPETVRVGAVMHHGSEGGVTPARRPTSLMPSKTIGGADQGWWLLRWASCCQGRGRRADPGQLSWLGLQRLKIAEMAYEMEHDRDYALYVALKLDRFMLWITAIGYTLAVILIFALGAQNNEDLTFG